MAIRDHLSQHEAAESLPLVTETGRTTVTEAMDENRTHEVVSRVRTLLAVRERDVSERRVRTVLDGTAPTAAAAALLPDADGAFTEAVTTLAQRYRRPYPSLLRLRFEFDEPLRFAAGQYVTVRYQGTPRPYSVASSPNSDFVDLCIRRVPGGRLTSELTDDLSVGDLVTIRGPNGEFTLKEPSRRDVVFLATGTGVAPLKSMIEYTFEEGRDVVDGARRDVWLFLGTAWKDDLAYRERFRELADEHRNFNFVPTLSRERSLGDWEGETAYVQYALMKYIADGTVDPAAVPAPMRPFLERAPATNHGATLDPARMEVYACGINAMVYPLVDAVRRVGVPDRYVDAEGYG